MSHLFYTIEFRGIIVKRHDGAFLIKLDRPIYNIDKNQVKQENLYNFYDTNSDLLKLNVCEQFYNSAILGEEVIKQKNKFEIIRTRDNVNLIEIYKLS